MHTFDKQIPIRLEDQRLERMHTFKNSINFGINNEILLTVATRRLDRAPLTILFDCDSLEWFEHDFIGIRASELIAENPSRTYRLEKEAAFECLPIIFLPENESAVFLGIFEKGQATAQSSEKIPVINPMDHYAREKIVVEMDGFKNCWLRNEKELAYQQLLRILGLGIGLTPTGDDFITGLFASLYAKKSFPSFYLQLKDSAKSKTNAVSYAEIREAVEGRFSQTIQNIFIAASKGEEQGITKAIHDLKQVGSTSGSDILWGIVFGLKLFGEEFEYGYSNSN
ncbi:uncharacterized protein DUF2877 [Trichococcus patagoniensis]|uniref:Uncharacterized protein DUF2877 n=1 Tax=Trichococcus patagoniensis TaxID=382641 RepID=A0A2T5ICC7_9LACT|nr:DUF2877 domain-containing protein [Trichococcus patagoniensis]PTQ81411.1 uncharacterized protein DUF2877 [Trichococcus patagoniensis]